MKKSANRVAKRIGGCAAAGWRWAAPWAGVLALWILPAGCAVQHPRVEQEIGTVTGIGEAIVFRHEPDEVNPPGEPGEMSLEEAVRRALMHDPRIQAALARVRVAEAEARQARLLPNPILNIDLRFAHATGSNTAFEATLTGDLVALLQKPAEISAADKRLRGSAADAVTEALDVMSEAQQAYLAAQYADAKIAWVEARRRDVAALREIAKKRLDAGDGTRLDVLMIESQLVGAELDLAELQQARVEARLLLAKLVGEPRGAAAWTLDPRGARPAGELAPEAAWIDAALGHRPEIQSKQWELKALGDDLTAAEFSPFAGGETGVHTERDPEWRTGPTMTTPLPMFDWGQAARGRIMAQRMAARHELAGLQADIIQDVRVAYAAHARAAKSFADVNEKLVPLLEQQNRLARLSFSSGESDLATLLLAESETRQTAERVLDLESQAAVARVKLQRAAGGAAVAAALQKPATQQGTAPASGPASASQAGTGGRP
jgi:cobalt-zinc-cadmium efflux system outer membrane protein